MTDDEIEIPRRFRWVFRFMYVMAGLTAVPAVILVVVGAWLPGLLCALLAIWPALIPRYWRGAYQLGRDASMGGREE